MDAISFVLGVKSSQLRSSQLKDLIYRDRAKSKPNHDNDESTNGNLENDHQSKMKSQPKTAHVIAVYQKDNGSQIRFMRRY